MKKALITFLILLFTIFTSCKKEISEQEFEKNVMQEIFPSLIDSIWIRTKIPETPPPVVYDNKKQFLRYGEKNIAQIKKDLNAELISFKKENKRMLVRILDTIQLINQEKIDSSKHLKILYVSQIDREIQKDEFNNRCKIRGTISFSKIKFDKNKKMEFYPSEFIITAQMDIKCLSKK